MSWRHSRPSAFVTDSMRKRHIDVSMAAAFGQWDKMIHRPVLLGYATTTNMAAPVISLSENLKAHRFMFGGTAFPRLVSLVVSADDFYALPARLFRPLTPFFSYLIQVFHAVLFSNRRSFFWISRSPSPRKFSSTLSSARTIDLQTRELGCFLFRRHGRFSRMALSRSFLMIFGTPLRVIRPSLFRSHIFDSLGKLAAQPLALALRRHNPSLVASLEEF